AQTPDEVVKEVAPTPAGTTTRPTAGVGARATLEPAADAAPVPRRSGAAKETAAGSDTAAQVVLDYCAAVRDILNDDQGGPLHPPGLRMAEALTEVQESLGRNLALNKLGVAH